MWFLFGMVSFIGFSVFFWLTQYRENWKGDSAEVNGTPYFHHISTDKGKTTEILLGCLATCDIQFSVKKENWGDRFFKAIGISGEFQVGRDGFDHELYIMSDQTEVCHALANSTALQEQIISILEICDKQAVEFKGFFIQNKRIWVSLIPKDKTTPPAVETLAREFIPLFRSISEGFSSQLAGYKTGLKDPFFWKASIILAISTSLFATGLVNTIGLAYSNIPFTVDTHELVALSWVVGSAIIGVLVIITLLLLGRTSRTHLVLIKLLTLGYIGAFLSAVCLLRDANIEFDNSQGIQYETQVQGKHISRGKRHTSYYLDLQDWNRGRGEKSVSVDSGMYYATQQGDKLEVIQNPGWLGFRWVSKISSLSWQSQ